MKEIQDKKPVESGEYDLRIKTVKAGKYGCMLVCEIDGKDAAEILLWIDKAPQGFKFSEGEVA